MELVWRFSIAWLITSSHVSAALYPEAAHIKKIDGIFTAFNCGKGVQCIKFSCLNCLVGCNGGVSGLLVKLVKLLKRVHTFDLPFHSQARNLHSPDLLSETYKCGSENC